MAVPSTAAQSIPPPITTGQGQSPSCDYFPASIAKRTRAQSSDPTRQRSAIKTDSSSLIAKEEEEPIPGRISQLRLRRSLNSVALQSHCLFLGKMNNSLETKSTKGKPRAPTNYKKANGQTDAMAKSKQPTDCQQIGGNSSSDSEEIPTEIVEEADLSWEAECKLLLEILNRSEDSVEIRKPVSILDLPDYLEFVDHPMDLQTVWRKLQDDHYATPKDFAKDVRFIFENANKLKPNISSAMIDRLSLLFEECICNVLFSYKHQKTAAQSKS